jgi:hypothetical protein
MAQQLVKLQDLKAAFADFDGLVATLNRIENEITFVNDHNKTAAGTDDIGQTYHNKVDHPTAALTDLINRVRTSILTISDNGKTLSDMFDQADSEGAALAQ